MPHRFERRALVVRALASGIALALLLSSNRASAEAPVEIDRLRARLVSPIDSAGKRRFLMEIGLTVRGVKPVPRGADLTVASACQIGEESVRDRVRLHAVQLHTLRARQLRGFTTALYAKRLLRAEPKQCEIVTHYVDADAKRSVRLARFCLRKGKTQAGGCSLKPANREPPRLAGHVSRDRIRVIRSDKVASAESHRDAGRGFIIYEKR